ncbi:MAG: hypothetical protein WCT23_10625, partial [Candidatus Neomarinimicrobiota bacterium]
YSEAKGMIDSGEEMYLSELEINSEGMMYPALGTYGRDFDFYWDLDPEDYPASRLLFISVESQYAAVEQYEEFLFNHSGELVFYYSSGGYDMQEERFYFNSGSLQRFILDDESTDRPDEETRRRGEEITMEAEGYARAFNLIH